MMAILIVLEAFLEHNKNKFKILRQHHNLAYSHIKSRKNISKSIKSLLKQNLVLQLILNRFLQLLSDNSTNKRKNK